MAYFRRFYDSQCYFFTVVSYARRPILCDEIIRVALRQAIQEVKQQYDFTINAWVLLPDHMHTIWTLPEYDTNYSRRWALIKRKVSQQCGKYYALNHQGYAKRHEALIWQRRFWEHAIRNEIDFIQHMNYVHFNPVKHGLVQQVIDWQYSTFHRYVKQEIYPQNWGGLNNIENHLLFGEPD